MIPWYIYAGAASLLVLAYAVNRANVLLVNAMATGAMIAPTAMGLGAPIWLEMIVLFPAICLILAFIGGRPRAPKAMVPDDRSSFTGLNR